MKSTLFLAFAFAFAGALAPRQTMAQAPAAFYTIQSIDGDLRSDKTTLTVGARGGAQTLRTGARSRATLRFDDGTVVTLDENSVLRVIDLAPVRRYPALDLSAGALRLTTGSQLPAEARQSLVGTSHANVGTGESADFAIAILDGTYVSVTRGSVTVTSLAGQVALGPNTKAAVPRRNAAPAELSATQLPVPTQAAFDRLALAPVVATSATVAPSASTTEPLANAVSRKFWLGAAAGPSHIDRKSVAKLIDSGTVDETSTGYKIFAGYQLHRYFGAEVSYVDLGQLSYEGTFGGSAVTGGKLKLSGLDLAALGLLPAREKLILFAKAGIFFWRQQASDSTNGQGFSASTKGSNVSLGLGASFNVTQPLAIRIEAETFKLGDAEARLISAGLAYRF